VKFLFSTLAVAFTYSIYWAFTQKPISASGAILLDDPWGIVTLIDLYIGFLLFGIFIVITIPQKKLLAVWLPLLLVLGNVVSLIYLIFYYKNLTKLFGVKYEN